MLVAGRYRLLEPVGAGGMGRVWLAHDQMLDREVAVKEIIPPAWMTEAEQDLLRHRTMREARSAARLSHPNVVRIYDVVHVGDLSWIVMEYIPSRSLHQVLHEDGPYAPPAAARIGLAVLDGLDAAHRAGVLHRDVKPHNVLIGDDGNVVLTDFGLAMIVDEGSITTPGLIVGSPQYVSPERAWEGASTVESDLWSLGATLYAAVEGRSPYARDTAMATLAALATEPPGDMDRAGPLAVVLEGLLRYEPETRLTADEIRPLLQSVAESEDADGERWPLPATEGKPFDPDAASRELVVSEPILAAAMSAPKPSGPETARRFHPRRALIAAGLMLAVLVSGFSVLHSAGDDEAGRGQPARSVAARTTGTPVPKAKVAEACDQASPAARKTPQKGALRGVNGWNLQAGWSYFTGGSGFHLAVPDGWDYHRTGTTYCFRNPNASQVLSIDVGQDPKRNPLEACRAESRRRTGPGYQLIGIAAVPLIHAAADWEYRYRTPAGAPRRAAVRWFVSGGKAYVIGWSTSENAWTTELSHAQMVRGTFWTDHAPPSATGSAGAG
nr:serine/threonine-protein kinase [Actinoplanes rectilineatus]